MSDVVDEKVVRMQFDSSKFEQGVAKTIQAIKNLKNNLKFEGAAKGIESINEAANRTDLSGITNACDSVKVKFDWLNEYARTRFFNPLMDSAIHAGKVMAETLLTTGQMKSGFDEYELKMQSVQTIMASTGESIETVNEYLNDLNKYSDRTIYSFSDMTQNIGKFTNAGVKLEDAVLAMKGISNEAAISGANANEASRAMYNLAQSLSMGYVQYIDWKSIENANMATVAFKKNLASMAVQLGVIADEGEDVYRVGNKTYNLQALFKDGMKDMWLTTDVLINTLRDYADENTEIGAKAYEAATKVKTFTMMMDTLKEAAQSGWSETFEVLFGNFNEASELWTNLNNIFSAVIDQVSDTRNELIKGGLDSSWKQLTDKIEDAGVSLNDFEKEIIKTFNKHGVAIENMIDEENSLYDVMTKMRALSVTVIKETLGSMITAEQELTTTTKETSLKLEDFQNVVNKVLGGAYGNGAERIRKLNEEGQNGVAIQEIINKIWARNGKTFKDTTVTMEDLISTIGDLTEEEIETVGITKEQAESLKQMAIEAKAAGTPLNELIEQFGKPSGRELLISSLMNVITGLQQRVTALGRAWNKVFGKLNSKGLYEATETINDLTKSFILSDEQIGNLEQSFAAMFNVLKLVIDIAKVGFKITGKMTVGVLKPLITSIGKIITSVSKLINALAGSDKKVVKPISDAINDVTDGIDNFAATFSNVLDNITGFVTRFIDGITSKIDQTESIQNAVTFVKDAGDKLGDTFDNLQIRLEKVDFSYLNNKVEAFKDFFVRMKEVIDKSEFADSLGEEVRESVNNIIDVITGFSLPRFNADKFIEGFQKFSQFLDDNNYKGAKGGILGIFAYIKQNAKLKIDNFNKNAMLGFADFYNKNGGNISKAIAKFNEILASIKNTFDTYVGKINPMAIITFMNGLLKIFILAKTFNVVGKVGDILEDVSKTFRAIATTFKWRALTNVFIGLGVLFAAFAGSVLILTKIEDMGKATKAVGMMIGFIVSISALLVAIGFISSKLSVTNISMLSIAGTLAAVGIALMGIAVAVKVFSSQENRNLKQSFEYVMEALIGMAIAVGIVGKLCGTGTLKAAGAIMGMLTGLKLMLSVLREYSEYNFREVKDGIVSAIGMLTTLAVALRIATGGLKAGSNAAGLGILMLAMIVSMKAMLGMIRDLGNMNDGELTKGMLAMELILASIGGMFYLINKTSNITVIEKGQRAISSFKGFATALIAAAGVIYILGKTMSTGELLKGIGAIVAVVGSFSGMLAIMGLLAKSTDGLQKVSSTLTMMTIMLGVLGVVVFALGKHDWRSSVGAASAVSILLLSMGGLIKMMASTPSFKIGKADTWVSALIGLGVVVAELGVILTLMNRFGGNASQALTNATAISLLLVAMSSCLELTAGKHYRMSEGNIMKWVKAMSAFGLVAAEAALIIGLLNKFGSTNPTNTIANVTALSELLLAMSGCMAICSAIGSKATAAIPALKALGIIGAALTGFIGVVGAISEIPGVKQALQDGVEVMKLLGDAIGGLIGGIIGGVADGFLSAISNTLPTIGENLSKFWTNAEVFISGIKSLSGGDVAKAAVLTGIISAMTAEAFLTSIGNFFGLSDSFVKMGENLSDFAIAAMPFFDFLREIPETSTKSAEELANAIIKLSGSNLMDAITSLIGGSTDFGSFGSKMTEFGNSMVDYVKAVEGITESDIEKIKVSSDAGKAMVELANSIAKEGGLVGLVFGQADIVGFGTDMITFGGQMISYASVVSGITKSDVEAIQNSTEAAKAMIDVANSIGNTGGLITALTGDNNIADFGSDMIVFGDCLMKYVDTIKGYDKTDIGLIRGSKEALKEMVSIAYEIPNTGGVMDIITGSADIVKFGDGLTALAKGIVSYVSMCRLLDDGSVDSIKNSKKAVKALADVYNVLISKAGKTWVEWVGSGYLDVSKFASNMTDLGRAIISYSESVSGLTKSDIKQIKLSKTAITAMSSAAKSIPNEGGLAGLIAGENGDAQGFIDSMIKMASGVITFSDIARNISTDQLSYIWNASVGIEALCNAAKAIPNEGGLAGLISGENDPTSFINGMTDTVKILKTFIDESASLSTDSESIITTFTGAIVSLTEAKEAINELFGEDGDLSRSAYNLNYFLTVLDKLDDYDSSNIATFESALEELGKCSVDALAAQFDTNSVNVVEAVSNMLDSCASQIRNYTGPMNEAITSLVTFMDRSMESRMSIFNTLGINSMKAFDTGMLSMKDTLSNDFVSTILVFANKNDTIFKKFAELGDYMMQGLANGIQNGNHWVSDAMKNIVDSAVETVRTEADIHSPSRVFDELGQYIPMGFANGIAKYASMVDDAVGKMTSTAISTTESMIGDLNTDEFQNLRLDPIVTPTIDSRNMRTEKLRLGSDVNMNITSEMTNWSQRIIDAQNAVKMSNDEVIANIKGLRDDIREIYDGNDTEVALYVDSKKLATSLARPMNKELNILSRKGAY